MIRTLVKDKENQSFIERCYKDKNGKTVLFQPPNPPIIGWFIFTILHKVGSNGTFGEITSVLAFGFLFAWAWLELFSGVNYIRRVLGLLIIIASVMNQVNL